MSRLDALNWWSAANDEVIRVGWLGNRQLHDAGLNRHAVDVDGREIREARIARVNILQKPNRVKNRLAAGRSLRRSFAVAARSSTVLGAAKPDWVGMRVCGPSNCSVRVGFAWKKP